MVIEKTTSVILSCSPYRETSLLMSLFSHQHGRLNVVAKGVRKIDKKGNTPIDRGYLVEHVVYLKQHRELHLITGLQMLKYYPDIRGNLEKTAVRDTLFEFLLAAIRVTDPHPELFTCITSFLRKLLALQPCRRSWCSSGERCWLWLITSGSVCRRPVVDVAVHCLTPRLCWILSRVHCFVRHAPVVVTHQTG